MKRYELTFLTSPGVSRENIDEISKKISDFVVSEGGSLEEKKTPIRKKIELPDYKKSESFLNNLSFFINPEKIEKLKSILIQEKNIIRHIIITKKKKEEESVSRKIPKAELKEIDEKIDEILKIGK